MALSKFAKSAPEKIGFKPGDVVVCTCNNQSAGHDVYVDDIAVLVGVRLIREGTFVTVRGTIMKNAVLVPDVLLADWAENAFYRRLCNDR